MSITTSRSVCISLHDRSYAYHQLWFLHRTPDCLPRAPLKRAIMCGLLAFREWILSDNGQAWNWPSHYHGSFIMQLFPFNFSFHSFIASSCSIGIRGFTYAWMHGNPSQYLVFLLVQYHKNTYPHLLWTAPPFLSSPPWHQHVFSSTQQASPFLYHAIVHFSYQSILVYSLVFQEFYPALSSLYQGPLQGHQVTRWKQILSPDCWIP